MLRLVQAPHVPYSPQLGEAICEEIACTPRGLDFICAVNPDFPAARSVRRWLLTHPEFMALYETARKLQAHVLIDEVPEIIDDSSGDTRIIERRDGTQERVMDVEWVGRSKIRMEGRFKMAAVLNPARYGQKLDVNARIGVMRSEDILDQLR